MTWRASALARHPGEGWGPDGVCSRLGFGLDPSLRWDDEIERKD